MGFCDLLKPRMAFAALFTSCISMYCVSFYSAFLAVQLEEVYGVPEAQMGYCFLLASGPYLIACIVLPAVLKNVPRRLQMIICFLVSSISIGLMGPSEFFVVLPDTLPVVLIGMFFLGFIQPLSFIPCLPEVIDQVTLYYQVVEGVDEEFDGIMHDSIAAIYNLFYSSSSFLSPIFGGFLHDHVGYKRTMDISMFLMGGIALLYICFNCTCRVYSKTAAENGELEKLQAVKHRYNALREKEKDLDARES